MTITLHHGDIPANLSFGKIVAVDTEMMGLNPIRDRLCLVQLSAGDGTAHLVKFKAGDYAAPNLKKLFADENVLKLFHFARSDIASIQQWLGVMPQPLYCTKIASKLVRTFTNHHGLKALSRDLLGIEVDKHQQTTDWGQDVLTPEQLDYAASDVLHLHKIKEIMDGLLAREGRAEIAAACFEFLPTRGQLDLLGWTEEDIFAH